MGSNGKIEMTREVAVGRAMAASRHLSYAYKLGAGGRNPNSEHPYNNLGQVDCSGFVAWALGYDRLQPGDRSNQEGRWVYTDSIQKDGINSRNDFRLVRKTESVLPGDLLVYAGTTVNGERKPGHVGMIVKVGPLFRRGEAGWHKHLSVAHATPSHRRKYGNVVAVTDAVIWRKKGYIVRYTGFAPDQAAAAAAVSVVPPKPLPSMPAIKLVLPGDDWDDEETEDAGGRKLPAAWNLWWAEPELKRVYA